MKVKYFFLFLIVWFASLIARWSWYQSNHATISVNFNFKKKDRIAISSLLGNAKILYLDNNSNILATGIYFRYKDSGFIDTLNPEIKNKKDIKECLDSRNALTQGNRKQVVNNFKKCFLPDQAWVSSWVEKFTYIQIEHEKCSTIEIPIKLTRYNDSPLLAWLPHGGSGVSTPSHYYANSLIEKTDCLAFKSANKLKRKGIKKIVTKKLTEIEKIRARLAKRFKGKVDIQGEKLNKHWQIGFLGGEKVWIEREYGLIWGQRLPQMLESWGKKDGIQADKYCNLQKPLGYWGVPTQAEYYISKKNGMTDVIEDLGGKWFNRVVTQEFGYVIDTNLGFNGFNTARDAKVSIRCVALNKKANRHGYYSGDFPLNYISGLVM